MSYANIIQDLPPELQLTMLKLVEAVEQQIHEQLASRPEDFDPLRAVVRELAEAQRRTERAVTRLAESQYHFQTRQDKMIERLLERQYQDKAYTYFSRILRQVQVVSFQELEDVLENQLPDYERNDLLLLDLLVRGQPRIEPDAPEVWLAIEISEVVNEHDVERAQRRAAILRRIGYPVIPAVAGKQVTGGGKEAARRGCVLLLQDETIHFWEAALAQGLA
jgi:hypothetical protein